MTPSDTRKPGRPRDPDLESRRKGQILSEAARVFAARGYADTDVQVIADALRLGKGTIYRYFPTKQELFLATVDRGLSDLSDEIDGLFDNANRDPLELVREAVTAYLRFFQKRPEMAELFIQERAVFRDRHTPLYFAEKYKKHDRDVPFINALIRLGRFRKMPADKVLDVVCDLLYGTVLSNHLAGRRSDPVLQAKTILDVLFLGMLSDPERKRMMKRRTRKRVATTALCVFLLSGTVGCGESSSASKAEAGPAPVVVTAEPVSSRPLQRTVTAVGTLNGFEEVVLSPKAEGRIIGIRADVGDRVAPGTVLLEIDPKDYDLAIAESTQALSAELAKLGLTELPAGTFEVAKVPAVMRAAASVEDAARRLAIKKDLLSRKAAAQDEVDLLETELKIAEATKKHVMTEAQATLAAARLRKASLESAQQRRSDCAVVVPTPSPWLAKLVPDPAKLRYAVAQRMVAEGEMVRAMPTVNAFKLVLDFRFKLRVMVPEKHVAEVAVGQSVDVTSDAYPSRVFAGTVTRINPTVDTTNRTFMVEIEVPNDDGALKCGGFAKASIRTKKDAETKTVPPGAVVSFAGVHKIFVIEQGKAKAIEVDLGTRDKEWVEIRGSIPMGASVITSGLTQVVDGSTIQLREAGK